MRQRCHDPHTAHLGRLALATAALAVATTAALPAHAARVLKGPYLQDLGPHSVEVRAELDVAASATVTFTVKGGSDSGAPRTVADTPATMHVLRVDGLAPSTRYVYVLRVGSTTQTGEFVTAPAPSSRDAFAFLVYGDNRSDDAAHAAVVRAMAQVPSDFILNTGDYVLDGSDEGNWQSFFDVEGPLLRDRCLFACVGNHELTDGAGESYLRYFGPEYDARGDAQKPKLYGSFRWGPARFFLLDAMETFEEGPERAWLEDELARADAESDLRWRIVVLHHSMWSSGPHGGNARALRAGIPALLASHHVDLVLGGHDHIYERGFASGLPYLISGGGGAPLYPIDHVLPTARKAESAHHFILATVSVDAIQIVAKRDDGSVLDQCGLAKATGSWDCDPPPKPGAGSAPPAVEPAAPGTSRCACRAGVSAGGSGEGAAAFALFFAAAAWARRRDRR